MTRQDCLERLKSARPLILPSMLLCDFANLEHEIRQAEAAGFTALHLDVMDGVFVPNITYGMTIVNAVRQSTDLIVDVHLMIVEPEKYLERFRDAGADVLTVHVEAAADPRTALEAIQSLDMVAGIALNPSTPVEQIESSLEFADLVLPMSVEPGFGGQSFDESVLPKFEFIRKRMGEEILLQIDGGINKKTIKQARQAGVDLFVVGSAIFKTEDYQVSRNQLRSEMGEINEPI